MDSVPRVRRYTPYIFTDAELLALFQKSDNQRGSKEPFVTGHHRYCIPPDLFLWIAPQRGREIRRNDIDTDNRTLYTGK